jgi:hypothetical protein
MAASVGVRGRHCNCGELGNKAGIRGRRGGFLLRWQRQPGFHLLHDGRTGKKIVTMYDYGLKLY